MPVFTDMLFDMLLGEDRQRRSWSDRLMWIHSCTMTYTVLVVEMNQWTEPVHV